MTEWADIENIRAEWPAADLEAETDLASWREGNQLYEANDDHRSMIDAAGLMCRALRHDLYGPSLFAGPDLPNTLHRVVWASSFPPPDGETLIPQAAKQLRLALTVVKKYGWQQKNYGGDGMMAEALANVMLLSAAVQSPNQPWTRLETFFTTHPIEIIDPTPYAPGAPSASDPGAYSAVDSLCRSMQDAESGDPAGQARMRGTSATMAGDHAAALREFEQAAQMGDVDSMYDAGSSARELGLLPQCAYWFERAAEGGHPSAMFNLGAIAYGEGDLETARRRYQQAAEAGDAGGYAALTQIADESGDADAEFGWSRMGANAGHPFCQLRHGQLLMRAHPKDPVVITQQAIPLLKKALDAGETNALFLIGIGYGQLDDTPNARLWLLRAEEAGDADATRVLDQYGLR